MRDSLLAIVLAFVAAIAYAGERRPMALMVFFDGARADGILNAGCTNLFKLAHGRWADGYRCAWSDSAQNIFDARTLSYPNHSSILCGVTARKHKVMNNDQVRKLGDKHGWPTWCKRLVSSRPNLRAKAFFSDRNDAYIMPDAAVPMSIATSKDWRMRDEENTRNILAAYRGGDAPDAGVMFLEDTDCYGHYCGYYPSGDSYLSAYAACDAKFGRVLDVIRSRPTFDSEDWMIVFTSDHGGKGLGHGWDDGHCHTVPLMVVSRHVEQGVLPGCPRTYDLAPTLLAHFSVAYEGLDGHVIGSDAVEPGMASLAEGLFAYEAFDSEGPLSIDVRHGERVTSRWGYANRLFVGLTALSSTGARSVSHSYGRVVGYDVSAAFRIEGSAEVFSGERPAFTLSFWMLDEGRVYPEDPIVMGNKNIFCFLNQGFEDSNEFPGFAIFLRSKGDDGSRGVTLKYTCEDGRTMNSLGAFTPERGEWNFYSLSVHPDGKVLFYHGLQNGHLHWIAADYGNAKWAGRGPLMVGQDVTGQYVNGSDLCFDELRLWRRALTTEEVLAVFRVRGDQL